MLVATEEWGSWCSWTKLRSALPCFSAEHLRNGNWFMVFLYLSFHNCGLPRWLSGKEFSCQCRRLGFHPWVRENPLEKEMAPSPVYLPGKFNGVPRVRLVYWAHIHINCPTVTVHGCHYLWSLIVSLYPIAGIDICPGASTQVKGPRFQPVSPQPFSPETGHKLSCERCPPLYRKGKSSLTAKDKSSPRIWTNKLCSFPQFTCLPHIP